MSEEAGRARGRGRGGRARGGESTEPARRPGPPPAAEQPPPPQVVPPATGAGGRATYRGGSRDVRPGQVPAEQMAQMRIGAGDTGTGRGAFRRQEEAIRTRPEHIVNKTGKAGQPIKLLANYYRLLSTPDFNVYQYHVDFAPVVESPRVRRALLYVHKERLGSAYIFDGMSDIKSTTRLEEFTELYSERTTDGENIKITLKRVAELAPTHPELLRLFNTQMRRNMSYMKYTLLGRYFYDTTKIEKIQSHRLELWPGFTTAIREHETGIMIVIDTIHKVLRRDTVLDLLREQFQKDNRNWKDNAIKEVTGSIVMTNYNNRTYKVDDIDFEKNPSQTFSSKEGDISYISYYQKQYQLEIKDQQQPLLVVRPSRRDMKAGRTQNIYLIPELCNMTGLTDAMRADFKTMQELATHTQVKPDKKVAILNTFNQKLTQNPEVTRDMDKWKIKFDTRLVEVQGRILPNETIIQRGRKISVDPRSADFQREMRGNPFHMSKNLTNWVVIVSERDRGKGDDFLKNLQRVCPPIGMQMEPPKFITIPDDRINSYMGALRQNVNPDTTLCLCIVSNNKKDRYDAIKKHCCMDTPVPSQVIVAKTLSRPQMLMSVATKVAVQMNAKLGGQPWAVEIPVTNTMIVGYDTYHDSSQRGKSAGALVATMNNSASQYYSQVSFHTTHQELSDALRVQFTDALKKYHEINGTLPAKVLYFRDGVSDGQVNVVKQHELEQLLQAIKNLAPDKPAQLAFIIINKRISTRFMAVFNDGYNNPPPGTVVDTEVTRPERYDFFLVSQAGRIGTAAPTQYNVIFDETGLSPEHLQRLSFKLTHVYYNWSGTVRVPAPCMYAHKLAFLAGQSLHKEHHKCLADKLFFL